MPLTVCFLIFILADGDNIASTMSGHSASARRLRRTAGTSPDITAAVNAARAGFPTSTGGVVPPSGEWFVIHSGGVGWFGLTWWTGLTLLQRLQLQELTGAMMSAAEDVVNQF